ncbi:MAG: hypothetical protein M0024_05495 [Nitrospiraceae bacterium]|nr:hypothetical protein [Nitrospiraceae bacterium]
MGWKVGTATSLAVAAIIEGKVELYPKGDVEVCLRHNRGILQFKAQSLSVDAGIAEWHTLKGKRKKEALAGPEL